MLQASFIPPQPIRDLRDLLRYRKSLVYARSQEINRVHKLLETANIKLSSVLSDIMGKSGHAMLEALLWGQSDPEALASLARGSLRGKLAQLREALEGRVDAHHRVVLGQLLEHIDFLEQSLHRLTVQIEQRLGPYEEAIERIVQIPGLQRLTASTILAEIGDDMSRFPSERHLSSWAGVAPGNHQSAGQRRNAPTTKGNRRLRAALAEAVWVISHTKGNYLSAQYHRLARRIGKKRAIVAVSHSLLIIIYHLLRDKTEYHELGPHFFEELDTERLRTSAVRRLEALGFTVTLQEKEKDAS